MDTELHQEKKHISQPLMFKNDLKKTISAILYYAKLLHKYTIYMQHLVNPITILFILKLANDLHSASSQLQLNSDRDEILAKLKAGDIILQ
jgi:hypothetical protein